METKIFIYEIVDICDELDVPQFKRKLKRAKTKPLRRRYFAPVYLNFLIPPLELAGRNFVLKPENLLVKPIFKFYALGSVTICYEISFDTKDYFNCFQFGRKIINHPFLVKKTKTLLEQARRLVEKELKIVTREGLVEDYSILWINDRFDPQKNWLLKQIAQFLRDESLSLSKNEQEEALKYQFSYTEEDLTVIDWDRAVTIDTSPQEDVWDVLEYANLQLLELRYHENSLEKNLEEFYKLTSRPYWRSLIDLFRMSKILQKLSNICLEFSEEEKKLNSFLRLTGDQYLARIYNAATKRLHIYSFQRFLKERLAATKILYDALYNQTSSLRMEVLEGLIVFLILVETILWFFQK